MGFQKNPEQQHPMGKHPEKLVFSCIGKSQTFPFNNWNAINKI